MQKDFLQERYKSSGVPRAGWKGVSTTGVKYTTEQPVDMAILKDLKAKARSTPHLE